MSDFGKRIFTDDINKEAVPYDTLTDTYSKDGWDLNYSFGDRFDVEANALTTFNLDWSKELMIGFMLSENLLESGNREFIELLNQKWKEFLEFHSCRLNFLEEHYTSYLNEN